MWSDDYDWVIRFHFPLSDFDFIAPHASSLPARYSRGSLVDILSAPPLTEHSPRQPPTLNPQLLLSRPCALCDVHETHPLQDGLITFAAVRSWLFPGAVQRKRVDYPIIVGAVEHLEAPPLPQVVHHRSYGNPGSVVAPRLDDDGDILPGEGRITIVDGSAVVAIGGPSTGLRDVEGQRPQSSYTNRSADCRKSGAGLRDALQRVRGFDGGVLRGVRRRDDKDTDPIFAGAAASLLRFGYQNFNCFAKCCSGCSA